MNPARSGLLVAVVFFAAALACSGILPLWLDEVLQLLETRGTSPAQMLTVLPRNPGAAPLGYLVQQAALRVGGYSVRKARFPMAIFAAGSVFLVAILAGDLGIQWTWLPATLFAVFPLTFRYATESRVYSQALFLSLLSTVVFVRLVKRPSGLWALFYALVLTAAIYTQPFAGSVGVAHLLWSLLQREKSVLWISASALAVSGLLFLPWYVWSKDVWAANIAPNALNFSATVKTPLMLFREAAGAGYWGSGLLLILCVIAIANRLPSSATQHLLILLIVIPFIGVLAADAWFDYFIAARQFIWVLPALSILAASAAEKYPRAALALAAAFCFVAVLQSVKYFTAPHEDFQLTARAMLNEAQEGACTAVAPKELSKLYEFFEPQLAPALCDGPRMVLAVPPYATAKDRTMAISEIAARRYKLDRETQIGGSSLLYFLR